MRHKQTRLQTFFSRIDRPFFYITLILVIMGLFAFVSAGLSVLAKNPPQFWRMVLGQVGLGLIGGGIAAVVVFHIPYQFFKKYAFWIFLGTLALTALVFIPSLSFSHGGATRWIRLGPFSLQPAEFLKFGFVVYTAAWYAKFKDHAQSWRYGLIPILVLLGLTGGLLLAQPDTGTYLVIMVTGTALYFVSGARWKHIGIMVMLGIVMAGGLVIARPYVLDRVKTFMNPSIDPQGSSYQIQQAFIAIGSGGILGRGYGQSVQKFNYLPEPTGDAIYAVIGEELGLVGGLMVILMFVVFALRGLRVAKRSPNNFTRLLVTGIIIVIVTQAFLNIASTIGVFPLTGLPLIFMSQGGTALMVALMSVSLVLQISTHQKKKSDD